MPKVSVVIPTCNRAHFLKAAVQSVLNQTFQDVEIIVVDDASKDQTAEIMAAFQDPRISYIRHETNKGQGRTRNAGIERASGEYVALLDDDDEWLPQKLEKQVLLLDSSPDNVGLVYTGFYRVDEVGRRVDSTFIPEKRGYVFKDLCEKNWIGTCSTVLLRKVCFEGVGLFDEELVSGADYDMWIRVTREFQIDCLHEPLVLYTVHDNRISTNHKSRIRGTEAQLKKYASYFAINRKGYSERYLSLGVHYCYEGDLAKGRQAFLSGIRLNPLEVRHYFNLCLSLLGAEQFRKLKNFKASRFTFHR